MPPQQDPQPPPDPFACLDPACYEHGYPADWKVQQDIVGSVETYHYQGATGQIFGPAMCIGMFFVLMLIVGVGYKLTKRWTVE
jgi:hypothetical protein